MLSTRCESSELSNDCCGCGNVGDRISIESGRRKISVFIAVGNCEKNQNRSTEKEDFVKDITSSDDVNDDN